MVSSDLLVMLPTSTHPRAGLSVSGLKKRSLEGGSIAVIYGRPMPLSYAKTVMAGNKQLRSIL
jgi:hypothetical protein